MRHPLHLAQCVVSFAGHDEADEAFLPCKRTAVNRVCQQNWACRHLQLFSLDAIAKPVATDDINRGPLRTSRQIGRDKIAQGDATKAKRPRRSVPRADNSTIRHISVGQALQVGSAEQVLRAIG